MIKSLLLVGLGGGMGSILRYGSSLITNKIFDINFPIATFFVNILGCLILGILFGLFQRNQLWDSNLNLLFTTGFCGGFTTFSAFSLESLNMFQTGNVFIGITYILASIICGLLAVGIGFLIAN